jgi:hypothetical protein
MGVSRVFNSRSKKNTEADTLLINGGCKVLTNGARKVLTVFLCVVVYLFGAYSYSHDVWPITSLREIKQKIAGNETRQVKDPYGRYTFLDRKTEIVCPQQTDKTVVALVYGQSNSANMYSQRIFQSSPRIVNLFDGKCYVASDPLLGTSGGAGSAWTLTGTKLLATGKYDNIIFVPAGIGGSEIKRWAEGGNLNPLLVDVIRATTRKYKFTHIIWHQGEIDAQLKTTQEEYKKRFSSMLATIRGLGVDAPVYVSVASICAPFYDTDNPITRAQRELVSVSQHIFPGPNTDTLNSPEDRFDDCHMSYTGMQKFSDLLLQTVFR